MKIYVILIILLVFWVADSSSCNTHHQSSNTKITQVDNSAREILQNVTQVYDNINSYKSEGYNEYTSQILGEDEDTVSFNFNIKYESPSKMDLEWNFKGENFKFISEDNYSYILVDGEKEIDFKDGLGILGAARRTKGGGFEVGSILLNRANNNGLLPQFENLKELELLKEESVEGNTCYVIRGKGKYDDLTSHTYWIDKNSYVIRQFESVQKSESRDDTVFKVLERYDEIKIDLENNEN